ncbi:MAG: hypothetical protein ACYDD1_09845, partial [Caulobacteraceae bacterium]
GAQDGLGFNFRGSVGSGGLRAQPATYWRWAMKRPPLKSNGSTRSVRLAASAGFVLGTLMMASHERDLMNMAGGVSLQIWGLYCLPPAIILGGAAAILHRNDKGKSS